MEREREMFIMEDEVLKSVDVVFLEMILGKVGGYKFIG